MRAVAYGAVIAATALVAAGCGSQHSAVSSDAGPGETRCNPLAGLEADHSGATLARVAQEHTPADGEIEAAALVWAIAIAGANGSPLDPAVADANPRGVTAFVQSAYPTAFASCSSAPVGSSVQKLVTSSDDFSCGNSCAPSPVLFEKALDTIVERLVPDRAMPAVGDRTQGWGLARLSNAGNSQMIAQAMSIAERAQSQGLSDPSHGVGDSTEALDFLQSVGQAVTTLGGIGGDLSPSASVALGMISAWQAGWEVGTATKVITDCNAWKSNHACGNGCCENGQICADPAGHLCCAAAETACGSNCCAGGQKCLDPASGTCGCATGETACGSNCCPAPEICVDAATSLCILCSDAETACGAVCCTSGKWCSSPGKSSCVDLCDGRYAVIVPGAQHDGRVSTQGEILDTQTMLRWDRYAAAVGEGTREEAAAYCRTRGMRLPTMTEALDVGYSVCAWSERWYTFTSDCMDLASGDPDGNRWSETGPKTSLCVRN